MSHKFEKPGKGDLDDIKKRMKSFLEEGKVMNNEETLGMKIAGASWSGDISFLKKVFLLEKQADILEVTKSGW